MGLFLLQFTARFGIGRGCLCWAMRSIDLAAIPAAHCHQAEGGRKAANPFERREARGVLSVPNVCFVLFDTKGDCKNIWLLENQGTIYLWATRAL